MSRFWFTADQHFGHRLLSDLRGFPTIEEHDRFLAEAWESVVRPGDVVFVLGDFMLPYDERKATRLLRRLPGTKQLIRGNHDSGELARLPGWNWVGEIRTRNIDGHKFVLCHYALRSWPGMGRGAIHLYGHSHGNLAPNYGRSMDVGVDTRPDMAPWNLDEVRGLLDPVPILIVDHHDEREGGG